MAPRRITFAIPYYENPAMLRRQQDEWATYPAALRARMHVVIVDDGSEECPALHAIRPAEGYSLELYRIRENKPWNQNGARNLALDRAPDGLVFMTDIDHVLERDMAPCLWAARFRQGFYYVPARRLPDRSVYHAHPNTYVMEKSLFWEAGGANEDYAGWYGSDSIFRRRIEQFGRRVDLDSVALTVFNLGGVDIGGVDGAATRGWGRKNSRWHARSDPTMRARLKKAHLETPTSPLRFTWNRQI